MAEPTVALLETHIRARDLAIERLTEAFDVIAKQRDDEVAAHAETRNRLHSMLVMVRAALLDRRAYTGMPLNGYETFDPEHLDLMINDMLGIVAPEVG